VKRLISALFAIAVAAVPLTAGAADLRAATYQPAAKRFVLKGDGLTDVSRVTLADSSGEQAEVQFTVRTSDAQRVGYVWLNDDTPGTYRMRLYDDQKQLVDTMDVTVPPPVPEVMQVTSNETCNAKACTAVAVCPQGWVVMGGGFRMVGYYDTVTTMNGPTDDRSWQVDVEAVNQNAYWTVAEAYAICLDRRSATGRNQTEKSKN